MIFNQPKTVLLAACMLFYAGPVQADGEKIKDLIVCGNKRIEEATILNAVSTKPGELLDSNKTDADIKAIFKLGQFQDVQVSREPLDDGVLLIYSVLEKPVVREIKFEGNDEFKEDKLLEGLAIKKNAIFSQKDLDKALAKIKKQYQDEGYYLVSIESLVRQRTPTDYHVTFKITEGEKVRIETITFEGISEYSPRKLKGVMETKEEWFFSWLTGAGNYKEEVLKNDALILTDFYMNNGFINVKVSEPVLKLADDKKSLSVHIKIAEGDQYSVGSINFKGDLLYPEKEIREKLKTEVGEVFSRANLRADINMLTDKTADKGYAFNNVNPMTRQNPEKKQLDITFDIDKGELIYIDRISIAGNSKTRDKVIRREMRLIEGDLYSATGFKRSKQNIMNTGYFEEANVASVKGSSANKLDIKVDVKEKPTGAFTIGGGYSSLDGMVFQGSISQSNFFGLGLKANASATIGSSSNTYSVGLTDPYFLDSRWTLGGDIYRAEREYSDYTRRLIGGDIKAGYPITDFIGTFWMYKYELKDIFNPDSYYLAANAKRPDIYELGQTTTSSIYASITHNNTDFRFDPSTGMVNTLSIEYAGLGGDNKYLREIAENSIYYPLWWKFVISTKLVVGGVQKAGDDIPIDEKFYLGGIGTLRGYYARTVSPRDEDGIYIGGEKELFGNIEIKFPLIPEAGVKGVFFFDYGNTWTSSGYKIPGMQTSYGGGIRWASPMGPLRLEYGVPINPRPGIDDKSGRFEFAIGSLF